MKPLITSAVHVDESAIDVPQQFAAQLRRADSFIRLAVTAAVMTLNKQPEWQNHAAESGLFVGTAFGPMQTNFDVLGLIVDEGQTSPTLFSHSVFNSAAGYLARLFSIEGSSQTLTDFSWPFYQAFAAGTAAISSGRLKQCLVLQVETYSTLLADARQRTGQVKQPWHGGAVCWLLTGQTGQRGWRTENITINSFKAEPASYLHRAEQLLLDERVIPCQTPLASAQQITDRLNREKNSPETVCCSITAPYGSVELTVNHN